MKNLTLSQFPVRESERNTDRNFYSIIVSIKEERSTKAKHFNLHNFYTRLNSMPRFSAFLQQFSPFFSSLTSLIQPSEKGYKETKLFFSFFYRKLVIIMKLAARHSARCSSSLLFFIPPTLTLQFLLFFVTKMIMGKCGKDII